MMTETAGERVSTGGFGTRVAQTLLWVGGAALLAAGGFLLLTTLRPQSLIGLAIWLAGAVILHDGILSAVLFGANLVLRKTTLRIPKIYVAITQVLVVVGGILTIVVVPEIWAKQRGVRNPTVLPFDYGWHLFLAWITLTVLTALVVVVVMRVRVRRNDTIKEVVSRTAEESTVAVAEPESHVKVEKRVALLPAVIATMVTGIALGVVVGLLPARRNR